MTTPLERLLAEEIPTGRFGGPRVADARPCPPHPVTAEEATAHYRDLANALGGRHLTAVPDHDVQEPAA